MTIPDNDSRTIFLPDNKTIEDSGSIVIIGANGSGKTRFSIEIQRIQQEKNRDAIRIAAQKSLKMSNNYSLSDSETGRNLLHFGIEKVAENNRYSTLRAYKYRDDPVIYLQDDFHILLDNLCSDDFNFLNKHRDKLKTSEKTDEESILEKLTNIWSLLIKKSNLEKVNPLTIKNIDNNNRYPASAGSDGERALIYMIGQCLLAPIQAIIIIDEPEQNLHKSVLDDLWDKMEAIRKDCTFIYLTHDLQFASTRKNAKKIWLQNYDGKKFEFKEIKETENIPEELLLEILGTRKPAIFVEGEKSSYDYMVYKAFYKDFKIIPCGSCSNVIKFTKTVKTLTDLYHLKVFGIVDKDFRDEITIEDLKKDNIFVLSFTEIENLFLSEELIRKIVFNEDKEQLDQTISNVKEKIFDWLKDNKNNLVSKKLIFLIKDAIDNIYLDLKDKDPDEKVLETIILNKIRSIKINDVKDNLLKDIDKIIKNKNYEEVIKIIDHKTIYKVVSQCQSVFKCYEERIKNFLQYKEEIFREVVKDLLPDIPH